MTDDDITNDVMRLNPEIVHLHEVPGSQIIHVVITTSLGLHLLLTDLPRQLRNIACLPGHLHLHLMTAVVLTTEVMITMPLVDMSMDPTTIDIIDLDVTTLLPEWRLMNSSDETVMIDATMILGDLLTTIDPVLHLHNYRKTFLTLLRGIWTRRPEVPEHLHDRHHLTLLVHHPRLHQTLLHYPLRKIRF
jgi:hypothetical protein